MRDQVVVRFDPDRFDVGEQAIAAVVLNRVLDDQVDSDLVLGEEPEERKKRPVGDIAVLAELGGIRVRMGELDPEIDFAQREEPSDFHYRDP